MLEKSIRVDWYKSLYLDQKVLENANFRFLSFQLFASILMAKRTKKVGVVGKYGTRYGASLRKQIKKMEITQHAKYTCNFCGKDTVKRKAVGIWHCRACKKVLAGGAWTVSTTTAATVRSTVRRLREIMES
ncbi:14014_t:CDS:2 [Funneliformis mosseae]|uniref:14014_t:CDS:1 n=2 Tax=Funneliformis TaxID=1117308 RepID=A0A9N8UYD7_FUNMO|nr:14014_t:CDS:2 [Funneliformis mosseae]